MKHSKALTPQARQIRNHRILATLLVIIIVLGLVGVFCLSFGKKHDRKLEGVEKTISYEIVNVRSKPSTSGGDKTIITVIAKGATVTLTGNKYNHLDGDNSNPQSWVEVKLTDGTIGWIADQAINWQGW